MHPFQLLRPTSESELLDLLSSKECVPIAGGTDLLPRIRRGGTAPAILVDLSLIDTLYFLCIEGGEIIIGALVTQSELVHSPLILRYAPALAQAAATVGCPQTRNRATLGGNLVNASPAADTVPPLLSLGARVRLVSSAGKRELSLEDFLLNPGRTALQPGEYLQAVHFPIPSPRSTSAFLKLGKRSGMAIAVASAAVFLQWNVEGVIELGRVALGSLAPTARRSQAVEACLSGRRLHEVDIQAAALQVLADISPIDDIRATASYRKHSAQVLVRRILETALESAQEMEE